MPRPIEFTSGDITKVDYADGDSGLLYASELMNMYWLVSKPLEINGRHVYTDSAYIKSVSKLMENKVLKAVKVATNYIIQSPVKDLTSDFYMWVEFDSASVLDMNLVVNGISKPLTSVTLGTLPIDEIIPNKPTMIKFDFANDSFLVLDTNNKGIEATLPEVEMRLKDGLARTSSHDNHSYTYILTDKRLISPIEVANSNESLVDYFSIELDLVNLLGTATNQGSYLITVGFSFYLRNKNGYLVNAKGNLVINKTDTNPSILETSCFIESSNLDMSFGIGSHSEADSINSVSTTKVFLTNNVDDTSIIVEFDSLSLVVDKVVITNKDDILLESESENIYSSLSLGYKLTSTADTNSPTFLEYLGLNKPKINEHVYYGNYANLDEKRLHRHNMETNESIASSNDQRATMIPGKVYLKGERNSGFNVVRINADKGGISKTDTTLNVGATFPADTTMFDDAVDSIVGTPYMVHAPDVVGNKTISDLDTRIGELDSIVTNGDNILGANDKYLIGGNETVIHHTEDYGTYGNNVALNRETVLNAGLQPKVLEASIVKDYTFDEGDNYFFMDIPNSGSFGAIDSKTQVHHDNLRMGRPCTHNSKNTPSGVSAYIMNLNHDTNMVSLSFTTHQYVPIVCTRNIKYSGDVENSSTDWISINGRWRISTDKYNDTIHHDEGTKPFFKDFLMSFNIDTSSTNGTKKEFRVIDSYEMDKFRPFIETTSVDSTNGVVMKVNSKPVTSHQFFSNASTNLYGLKGHGVNTFDKDGSRNSVRVYQPLYRTKTHAFTFPLAESVSTCVFLDLEDGKPYMYGDDTGQKCDALNKDTTYDNDEAIIYNDPTECFVSYRTEHSNILNSRGIHVFGQYSVIEKDATTHSFSGATMGLALATSSDGVASSANDIKLLHASDSTVVANVVLGVTKDVPNEDIRRIKFFEGGDLKYVKVGTDTEIYPSYMYAQTETIGGNESFKTLSTVFNTVYSSKGRHFGNIDSIGVMAFVYSPDPTNNIGYGVQSIVINKHDGSRAHVTIMTNSYVDLNTSGSAVDNKGYSKGDEHTQSRYGVGYITSNIGNPTAIIERSYVVHANAVTNTAGVNHKQVLAIHNLARSVNAKAPSTGGYMKDTYVETRKDMFYGSFFNMNPTTQFTPYSRVANSIVGHDQSVFDPTNPYLSKYKSIVDIKRLSYDVNGIDASLHYTITS